MLRPCLACCALLGALAFAAPAVAASCYAAGSGPDIGVGVEFHFGDAYTEDEVNDFNLMQLRQMGVDATRAEIWGGCIRAFVRNADGRGEHMEYFNARTLEPAD